MPRKQRMIFALVLALVALLTGWFHLGFGAALLLVVLVLLLRQFMTMQSLINPPAGPELELETILPSHFAEKGRWCMDRLGVDYHENRMGGIIGVFFTGRTVPMLTVRTGRTLSSICESSHILRYLYGRYLPDPDVDAGFLEPTRERREWEERLDQYGVFQQVWVYHHMIRNPALCKEAWGAYSERLPLWQRWTILIMYPFFEMLIRRGFQPDAEHYVKAVEKTEELLASTEALLNDGRTALLGGDEIDFVDITLASLSALWVQPSEFAAGAYEPDRIALERLPTKMREDMNRWRISYPATTAHIERLYAEERSTTAGRSVSEAPAPDTESIV